MAKASRSAIIIGGGPAGIATALALHQQTDISCRVYELRPEPTTLGGAIGLVSNGLRQMDRLGLYQDLYKKGNSTTEILFHGGNGKVLGQTDFVGKAKEETGYGYMRLKRVDLMEVMLGAAERAQIPIRYGKRLTAINESDSKVTVTFADGTTDTADYVLGCDGIHSKVRTSYVDPDLVPVYSGMAGMFSVIESSDLAPSTASQIRSMNTTMTQDGFFMAMPCKADDSEIYWGFQREVSAPRNADSRDGWELQSMEEVSKFKETILGVLDSVSGEWRETMKELVEKTTVMKFYPIYKLPSGGKWYRGRVLLLGDAAHAMQPHAGQGVSMALEDAMFIAKLLGNTARTTAELYKRYDTVRRPRVEGFSEAAAKRGEMRKKTGPWGLWAKETAIWASLNGYLPVANFTIDVEHLTYDILNEGVA